MDMMGVKFDLFFSEKKLHKLAENFCSILFVVNGVVTLHNRCSQCGKKMQQNTICYPCWKIFAPHAGLDVGDLDEWAKNKQLSISYTSVWDGYNEFYDQINNPV
jgi:hypothetical protein